LRSGIQTALIIEDSQTTEELAKDIKLSEWYKSRNWHESPMVDFSEDIWALGEMMYSLCAYLPLFALSSTCIDDSITKLVVDFLKQCLYKDKGNRFATTKEALGDPLFRDDAEHMLLSTILSELGIITQVIHDAAKSID